MEQRRKVLDGCVIALGILFLLIAFPWTTQWMRLIDGGAPEWSAFIQFLYWLPVAITYAFIRTAGYYKIAFGALTLMSLVGFSYIMIKTSYYISTENVLEICGCILLTILSSFVLHRYVSKYGKNNK